MAEVLGLVASIVAIIQVADRIIDLTKNYIETLRDAPRDLHTVRIEISTLKAVLESLCLLQHYNEPVSENLKNLSEKDGVIDGCKATVLALEALLDCFAGAVTTAGGRRNKIQVTLTSLAWPLKETKVKKLLEEIARYKGTLTLSLTAETTHEIKAVRAHQVCAEEKAILDWLTPVNFGSQQSDFSSRLQRGTGQWLLESDEFESWINANGKVGNRTLFCPGIPGAGKTMLTARVIENLQMKFRDDPHIAIAYIFLNFQRQAEQKAENILASILKQLAQGCSSFPDSLRSLHTIHEKQKTRPTFSDLSRAIHMQTKLFSRFYLILDGLDEGDAYARGQTVQEIFNWQATSPIHLFATSRFIPDIMNTFSAKAVSLEISATRDDIVQYLEARIYRLPAFVRESPKILREITNVIADAVGGMFLLAQIYLDCLEDKVTLKSIKATLREFQDWKTEAENSSRAQTHRSQETMKLSVLNHAYGRAMERIQSQKPGFKNLAVKVLAWITQAKRPLILTELQEALAVEEDDVGLDRDNMPQAETITSVCAGLVTIDEESAVIRLVHYTTQSYLAQSQGNWFQNAASYIATTCITYLSFPEIRMADKGLAGLSIRDFELPDNSSRPLFYNYAQVYWGSHAKDSKLMSPKLLKFLEADPPINLFRYATKVLPTTTPPLHVAANVGLEDGTRHFLMTIDVNSLDGSGMTALCHAAANAHLSIVSMLLDKGAEIDPKDNFGLTPLAWAASNGHEEVVRCLLAAGKCNLASRDERGQTPLSLAAGYGHTCVVRCLLEHDIEIETRDFDFSSTPLLWAAWRGHKQVVDLLLQTGADPEPRNFYRSTPLSLAVEGGHRDVVHTLLAYDGVICDPKDYAERTPLSYAAAKGFRELVEDLLDVGADLESLSDVGRTPLSYAAEFGLIATVRLLLERGANPDAKDQMKGLIPAQWAVRRLGRFRAEQIVEILKAESKRRSLRRQTAALEVPGPKISSS